MSTEVTTPPAASVPGAGLLLRPQPEFERSDSDFDFFGYDAALRPTRKSVAYAAVKRSLDIVGACAALLLFSPLLIVVALCVKLTDFGPDLILPDSRRTRWAAVQVL